MLGKKGEVVWRITGSRKLGAVKWPGDFGECLENALHTQGVRQVDVIGILE